MTKRPKRPWYKTYNAQGLRFGFKKFYYCLPKQDRRYIRYCELVQMVLCASLCVSSARSQEFRRSSSVENLPTSSSQNTSLGDLQRPLNTFGGAQVTPGVGSLHTSTPDHQGRKGNREPQLRDSLLGARTDLLSNANSSRGRTLDVSNTRRERFGGLRRSLAQDFETAGRISTTFDSATQDYLDVLNITT